MHMQDVHEEKQELHGVKEYEELKHLHSGAKAGGITKMVHFNC